MNLAPMAAEMAIKTAQIKLIEAHLARERQFIAELAAMRAKWEARP